MRLAVIGAGYVGLATAVGFAELGHEVICAENDAARLSSLMAGVSPIDEPGVPEALKRHLGNEALSFVREGTEAVEGAGIVFLCLPTPQGREWAVDLSIVRGVVGEIKSQLVGGSVVVLKSTVPPGTSAEIRTLIDRDDVGVVANPEFLRQGSALEDFLHPDRIIVGGVSPFAEIVVSIFGSIDAPILTMSAESAELVKYAANSFLATKLTYINAIADICEIVGAEIDDVVDGIAIDPRIGPHFLKPGPGWGGSCFPKDTRALVTTAAQLKYDFSLLKGVIDTNTRHYGRIVEKIKIACGGTVDGRTVAAWGLTFKAHTDDLRDSPAVSILGRLLTEGGVVCAFDPRARNEQEFLPGIERMSHPVNACRGANALVVLTEWPMFSEIDPVSVGAVMKSRAVIDGRNILDRERWEAAGFTYCGVGR